MPECPSFNGISTARQGPYFTYIDGSGTAHTVYPSGGIIPDGTPVVIGNIFDEQWASIGAWTVVLGTLTTDGHTASVTETSSGMSVIRTKATYTHPANFAHEWNVFILHDVTQLGFMVVDASYTGFMLTTSTNTLQIQNHNSVIKTLTYAFSLNAWHNVRIEVRGTQQKVIIDGVLVDTSTISTITSPIYLYQNPKDNKAHSPLWVMVQYHQVKIESI